MSILLTHPGRNGDVLWSIPTARAIKAANPDQDLDLILSAKYGSLVPLLECQPYFNRVWSQPDWQIEESAPITPREPPPFYGPTYDQVVHLGYPGWPIDVLPKAIYQIARQEHPDLKMADLDLTTPWIKALYKLDGQDLVVGFTDEHFEYKYGLYWLLRNRFIPQGRSILSVANSPRWTGEGGLPAWDWETQASWITHAKVFVGCNSALHVLACAVGTPVVCVEPAADRHHAIFWPYGTIGPEVVMPLGGDGKWTLDSRHVGDEVEKVWAR